MVRSAIDNLEANLVALFGALHDGGREHVVLKCTFGVRPEDIYDRNLEGLVKQEPGNTIKVTVDVVEPLGSDVEMYFTAGTQAMTAMIDSKTQASSNEELDVVFDMDKTHLFDKQTQLAIY